MAREDALFLTGASGSPSYSAREFRQLIAAMWTEGVRRGFRVVPRPSGAGFAVSIGGGEAVVAGDTETGQGSYFVRATTAEEQSTPTQPGSNTVLHRVVLEIRDPTAAGQPGNDWNLRVIAGQSAATPVMPAEPPSAITLARIGPISPSHTAINAGDITDLRPWSGDNEAPGIIRLQSHKRVPTGWLLGMNQTVNVTDYPDLADAISNTYGGNGTTTFVVPDYRGITLAGAADMDGVTNVGSANNGRLSLVMGSTVSGEVLHTLIDTEGAPHYHGINHNHTPAQTDTQSDNHTHGPGSLATSGASVGSKHSINSSGQAGGAVFPDMIDDNTANGPAESSHGHAVASGTTGVENATHFHGIDLPLYSGNSGSPSASGTGHNTVQPTRAVYVIIKT